VATAQTLQAAAQSGVPSVVLDPLRAAAYADFLSASHLAAGISAAIVILAALIVGFMLPNISPPQAPGAPAETDQDTEEAPINERIAEQSEHYPEELAEELDIDPTPGSGSGQRS